MGRSLWCSAGTVPNDPVGGLLALIADEIAGAAAVAATPRGGHVDGEHAERSLRDRIIDGILHRCTDPTLTAPQVAAPLGISTRTLHRALATSRETFGAALIAARIELAVRMLESPLFRRLTVAEIGRRSGFADPSHFSRVIRQQLGRSPSQLRTIEDSGQATVA